MTGGGGSSSVPTNPPFDPEAEFPTSISPDRFQLSEAAAIADKRYYGRSDADFKKRHRGLFQAEKLFEDSVLEDQRGESELTPALQSEFMRAGLTGAGAAFGDTAGTLTPGSAAEASVARNLGTSIMGFQDRNRQNRMSSIAVAETLFPRRTFGLAGSDLVNLELAKYNSDVATEELNWRNEASNNAALIGQENAEGAADAAQSSAMIQGGVALLGTVALAVAF